MSTAPTASPITLDRWEKSSNLAALAALASSGQVTIRPNELIRTSDSNRVYHWTGTAMDIVSAPVHHGTVANPAALDGIYLLPSCTRGVHPGDTAFVTAAGCEYRVTSGINATATWSACATIPTIPTTPSEVGADPSGTAATAVSTHNTATDSHTDIRTLIADRALIEHQHARTDLPWITDPGAALLTAASASAQRTALGLTQWAVAPWTDGTTSDVPEGSQLYFTPARANACADARIAAQKGQAEGLAPLGAGGKVPSTYLPDSITSFNGRTGAILPIASDYSAFYLGLGAQASDSAKLGGVAASSFSQTSHTHLYAGSAAAGGSAYSADKLATARNIGINPFGTYDSGQGFDGSSDVSLSVPIAISAKTISLADLSYAGNSMGMVFASDSPYNQNGEWGRFVQMSFSDQGGNAWQTQIFQRGTTGEIALRSQQGGALGANFGPWYAFLTAGSHPKVNALESVNGYTGTEEIGGTQCVFSKGLLVSTARDTRSLPCFIGDSITAGTGAPTNCGWVNSSVISLGVVLRSTDIFNYGVGGERTDQVNARLPALLSAGWKNIFYSAGANDANQSIPLSTFAANITQAINLCKAAGARIFVCTPIQFGSSKSASLRALVEIYREWILSNVAVLGGIPVDTYTNLVDQSTGCLRAAFDSDGIHPTMAGHNEIAKAVVDTCLKYFDSRAYLGTGVSTINNIPDPTNASSGPLALGWSLGTNSNVSLTPAIVSDTSGLLTLGRWQEFGIVVTGAGAYCNYTLTPSPTLNLVAGNTYAVSFEIQIEDVGGGLLNSINTNASGIHFIIYSGGSMVENLLLSRFPARSSASNHMGRVSYTFTPSTSYSNCTLTLTAILNDVLSIKIRVGRLSIINLTGII